MSEQDIVVVGKRDSSGGIYGFSQLPPGRAYRPKTVEEGGNDDDFVDAIYVRVHVTNKANQSAAIAAAQELAKAITRVKAALENTSATSFTANGVTYSVGDVLANLDRTIWFVNDTQNFNNKGVGTAAYSATGNNTDTIYFGSLGPDGYAAPGYTEGEGMTALIIHELSHMSQAGYDFFNKNIDEYKSRNHGSSNGFYDSPFAGNVEAFANDLMLGLASTIGANIINNGMPVIPGGQVNAQDPAGVAYP